MTSLANSTKFEVSIDTESPMGTAPDAAPRREMRSSMCGIVALLIFASPAHSQVNMTCEAYNDSITDDVRTMYVAGLLDGWLAALGGVYQIGEVLGQQPERKLGVDGDSIPLGLLARWTQALHSQLAAEVQAERTIGELVLRLQALCNRQENHEKKVVELLVTAFNEMREEP